MLFLYLFNRIMALIQYFPVCFILQKMRMMLIKHRITASTRGRLVCKFNVLYINNRNTSIISSVMPIFAGFTLLKCRNMALAFLIYMFFSFICKLFMRAKVYKIFRFCKIVLLYMKGKTELKGEMLLFFAFYRYLATLNGTFVLVYVLYCVCHSERRVTQR